METHEIESCIRGYHVYQSSWEPVVSELLLCERYTRNNRDSYAVSVKKGQEVVGHLPRKISPVCSLFLRRGGSITCRPAGRRRYSSDLPQGGLEIPCLVLLEGDAKEIKKLVKLLSTTGRGTP